MECNKDEAIRAKEIAEKKMLDKDFSGARRIALKAQRLYPDCDDISLMLSVCDVHCSAEQRMLGNEMDWYGILQIDQSANEASIKKQFRKLALLLHPDKNKFPGAEAAFKLTGEAQRLLLDQGRRSLYDMKYKASGRHVTPTQQTQNASESSNVGNNCSKKFTGLNPPHQQPQQQNQTVDPNGLQTFWTICSSCTLKHEYYRVFVNKILRCQSCSKPFVAYDINFQGASPETNCSEPGKVESRNGYNHTSNGAHNGNLEGENSKTAFFPEKRCCSEVSMGLGTDRKSGNVKVKNRGGSDEVKPSLGEHYKRRRKQECNESCDSGSCRDSKIEFECLEDRSPRKSRQKKHNASVNENLGGEECLGKSPKRAERSGLSCSPEEGNEDASLEGMVSEKNHIDGSAATTEEDVKDSGKKGSGSFKERLPDGNVDVENTGKEKVKGDYIEKGSESFYDSASNEKPEGAADPEFHTFPDSDFSNFDKEGGCFRVGQIWACYDTLDAMPRFYARIRAVYSPGFKLKITWLTPEPDDEDEITWVNEDLPVSCGKFVPDKTEVTEDYLMFSHLNYWEKGSTRGSYKIYPRIGETWALFKNWDIEWKSDTNNKRAFEFEFVEILSEYVEGPGISVARLGKIKGFSCLFYRTVNGGGDSFRVPPNQLYRFSHRVPSFKMTGEEREDVPRGSFELDPASLPTHLEEIPIPENIGEGNRKTHTNGSCSKISSIDDKPLMGSVASTSMYRVEKEGNASSKGSSDNVTKNPNSTQAPNPETYQIPDPEFYDFDADKPIEKFQIGQVWALYGDEDGLPKYYGQIKHIYCDPHFRMHLTWFLPCPLPEDMVQWHDKEVAICCGRFKLKRGKPQIYESIGPFSHQLRAEVTNKKGEYIILPRKGEIWALYKQWNAEMKHTGLYNCEYDIVEILEESDSRREALALERVHGFNSVFKAQLQGKLGVTMEIPNSELLRFSHQIPAFKLTKERNGSLNGFWELDPASLPVSYFCTD